MQSDYYPGYIVTKDRNRLRPAFWYTSAVLHVILGFALWLNRNDSPPQMLFQIQLVDSVKRVPEKEAVEIKKAIDKINKEKASSKKNTSAAGATKLNRETESTVSPTEKPNVRPVDREEQFAQDFEKTMFTRKQTASKSVPLPGGSKASKGWEEEGKKGSTGKKTETGESIKAPEGKTGTGTVNWEGGYSRRLMYMPKIDYPLYYRQQGIQTDVTCRIEVNATGKVVDVQITKGSGHTKLDILAKNALRSARFSPGSSAENDIGEVVIKFSLRN